MDAPERLRDFMAMVAVCAALFGIAAYPWPKCNANSPPAFGIGNAWVQEGCVRHVSK